jgi:hypothetical protein
MTAQLTQAELEAALAQRGLLAETASAGDVAVNDRPWFVSAVLGAAGWLAGVFVLFFVYLLFEPDSAPELGLAGAILVAAAYALYRADRRGAFFTQLALALSIAGQIAVCASFGAGTESVAATAALTALMQLGLLFAMPNALARALAAFFACVAWAIAVRFALWDRSLFDAPREPVTLFPVLLGWLAIWAPIAAAAEWLVRREPHWVATGVRPVARAASSGIIAALAVGTWASEPFAGLPFGGAAGTSWLALWPLLGTATAAYAAFCALRYRNRALLGLAIAGALLHTLQFYFVLGVGLLAKSAIMAAVGAALLAAAWALRRRTSPPGREAIA